MVFKHIGPNVPDRQPRSRKAGQRQTEVRRRARLSIEVLDDRIVPSVATIQTANVVRTVNPDVLGINITSSDTYLSANHDGSGTTPDSQTVQMLKAAGVQMIRITNGTSSDNWDFNLQTQTDPKLQFDKASAGLMANVVSAAGDDAVVTLNYGTGTPLEATAYVAYLDGSTTDNTSIGTDAKGNWQTVSYWAKLRSAAPLATDDGLNFLRANHPVSYGFTHFELGNEIYFFGWDGAPQNPNIGSVALNYAGFAQTFSLAASKIVPNLSVGFDVASPGTTVTVWNQWNEDILADAKLLNFTPGFLSDHFYAYVTGSNETLTDQQLLENTVTDPASMDPQTASPLDLTTRANEFHTLLQNQLGASAAQVQLLCTEFNSDATAGTKQSTSLVNGLYFADVIGASLQTDYQSALAWDLRNFYDTDAANPAGYYGWRTGGDLGLLGEGYSGTGAPATGFYVPYPAYFAEELASHMIHAGDKVVSANSTTADFSVYAVMQQDGDLDLLIINKSPTSSINETFDVDGFTPQSGASYWQYGETQDNAQEASADGSSALATGNTTLSISSITGGSSFAFSVPSYSMTVLQLTPASNTTAATLAGTVYLDLNANGVRDGGEPGLAGQTVFLDMNNDGVLDPGDPLTSTNANGGYSWTIPAPGTYTIRQVLLGGVLLSAPASGSYSATVTPGSNISNENFGELVTSITVPLTLPSTTTFPVQGNANADYVEGIYRAVLDRNADQGGLALWTGALNDGSLSRLQVVQGIRNSPEHFAQEVDAFYQTLLRRTADADGQNFWVGQLENGMPEEKMAAAFLNSPEYLSNGDKFFIDSMYESLLGRSFDSTGEAFWLSQLGDDATGNPTGASPPQTHAQVVTDFLYSTESLQRLVEGYYEVFLQRQADTSGLNGWVSELQQGLPFLTIGEEFVASDEFYNKAASNN